MSSLRFNRRRSGNRGKLFYRLVRRRSWFVPYKSLVRCADTATDRDHNL